MKNMLPIQGSAAYREPSLPIPPKGQGASSYGANVVDRFRFPTSPAVTSCADTGLMASRQMAERLLLGL
jgi:hypothetical protein